MRSGGASVERQLLAYLAHLNACEWEHASNVAASLPWRRLSLALASVTAVEHAYHSLSYLEKRSARAALDRRIDATVNMLEECVAIAAKRDSSLWISTNPNRHSHGQSQGGSPPSQKERKSCEVADSSDGRVASSSLEAAPAVSANSSPPVPLEALWNAAARWLERVVTCGCAAATAAELSIADIAARDADGASTAAGAAGPRAPVLLRATVRHLRLRRQMTGLYATLGSEPTSSAASSRELAYQARELRLRLRENSEPASEAQMYAVLATELTVLEQLGRAEGSLAECELRRTVMALALAQASLAGIQETRTRVAKMLDDVAAPHRPSRHADEPPLVRALRQYTWRLSNKAALYFYGPLSCFGPPSGTAGEAVHKVGGSDSIVGEADAELDADSAGRGARADATERAIGSLPGLRWPSADSSGGSLSRQVEIVADAESFASKEEVVAVGLAILVDGLVLDPSEYGVFSVDARETVQPVEKAVGDAPGERKPAWRALVSLPRAEGSEPSKVETLLSSQLEPYLRADRLPNRETVYIQTADSQGNQQTGWIIRTDERVVLVVVLEGRRRAGEPSVAAFLRSAAASLRNHVILEQSIKQARS